MYYQFLLIFINMCIDPGAFIQSFAEFLGENLYTVQTSIYIFIIMLFACMFIALVKSYKPNIT